MNTNTETVSDTLPGESASTTDITILYVAIGFIVIAAAFFLWWVRAMEKRSKDADLEDS